MDDKFLHELRREPTPAFSRRLRAALDDKAERQAPNVFGAGLRRYLPLAASLLIVSVAFTFPTVRAGAQAFLDMFRVVNFVPVQFDGSQLQQLASSGLDLPALIADDVEALTPPAAPVSVATLEDAAAMAGIDLIQPAWRPVGYDLTGIQVGGGYAARIRANTSKLELLLDAMGIDDLSVPVGLDGQEVMISNSPVVHLSYGRTDGPQVQFFQSRSPEVALPDGIDLPSLAQIVLRIMGVDRERAYDLAWTVDWRSTMIVPVPANGGSFREINIAGHDGLAIQSTDGKSRVLLWATGERVYAMIGSLSLAELLEMAQSAQ